MLTAVLITNILSHLFLYVINDKKIDAGDPLMVKLIGYGALFSINILIMMALLQGSLGLQVSYALLTLLLFSMHFILDEDFIVRFDKPLNLFIMTFVSVAIYGVWWLMLVR